MSIAEKLTTIAENEQKVYDAGKQAERKAFWDMVQRKGERGDYQQAFRSWYADYWNPIYDIKPTSATYMFYAFLRSDGQPINLPELLDRLGITIDFSKSASFGQIVSYSEISHLGTIDATGAPSLTSAFIYATNLQQVYLKIKEDGTTGLSNLITGSSNITDFQIISGKIGVTFSLSPATHLSKTSIVSVINALLDSAEDKTVTFSKTAVNNAFGIDIDDETTYPEGSEWYELRNSKQNWTFSFA